MPKNTRSRRGKRSSGGKRNQQTRKHRRNRRRGGNQVSGAPLSYSMSGDWASQMSQGQGVDYEQIHGAQHGGELGQYPAAIDAPGLISSEMQGPAMTTATMQSMNEIKGMSDLSASVATTGGKHRRRHRGKRHVSCKCIRRGGRREQQRSSRRRTRQCGAGEESAPVNMPTMLLPNKNAYSMAGLNPDYRGAAVEYTASAARDVA